MSKPSPRRSLSLGGLLIGIGLLLSSCVSTPPRAVANSDWMLQQDQLQDLHRWELRGRVNIRYDNESYTPRIQWSQQSNDYQITLWGTFNAGYTHIVGRPGYVTLEQGGDILSANSPEQLILQQLGYELPVSYLKYWIKGLPAPGSVAELVFNELNQLSQLRQEGWTVDFTDARQYDAITLPRRVELTRAQNDIRLRFIGLNWTLEDSSD